MMAWQPSSWERVSVLIIQQLLTTPLGKRSGGSWPAARGDWSSDRAHPLWMKQSFSLHSSSFWASASDGLYSNPTVSLINCVNLGKWPNFSEALVPYLLNENDITMFFIWLIEIKSSLKKSSYVHSRGEDCHLVWKKPQHGLVIRLMLRVWVLFFLEFILTF